MSDTKPPWEPVFFVRGSKNECPALNYLLSETDQAVRARIVRKIEHLANVGRENQRRPLIDTLDGPIKELRVDQQVRILFSWEEWNGKRLVLILEGTRKKNGSVDPKVVQNAHDNRQEWLEKPKHGDLAVLKKALAGG